MRPLLDPVRFAPRDLPSEWRAGQPFPHLIVDDFLDAATLEAVRAAVTAEPHWPEQDEIVECLASAPTPRQAALRALTEHLGSGGERAHLRAITGRTTESLQLRSYVYPPGGYLLPHTDHRPGVLRQVAFVLYLSPAGTFRGGALDLYRCRFEGGEIVATTVEATIEPRPNRLVLFAVSDGSLHRVREVTEGARASLAGWFL